MSSKYAQAVLKTLVYAEIFDYPLKEKEILKWLIGIKAKPYQVSNILRKVPSIRKKGLFYFLPGKEDIFFLRQKRKKYSAEKIKKAQGAAKLLRIIPSIKLVGLTGALAIENAKEDDDIDFFIITSAGLLWLTRFLATLLIEIIGERRHPQEISAKNKICLNMFMGENHLCLPLSERDLYSAHEVVQMKLLWDREGMHQKFLRANSWVKFYLPNAFSVSSNSLPTKERKKKSLFLFWDYLFKKMQINYMKKRRTKEIISEGMIRFHPKDAREWILREYREKLRTYLHKYLFLSQDSS